MTTLKLAVIFLVLLISITTTTLVYAMETTNTSPSTTSAANTSNTSNKTNYQTNRAMTTEGSNEQGRGTTEFPWIPSLGAIIAGISAVLYFVLSRMLTKKGSGGGGDSSITFWGRLEPSIRTPFLDEVLAASVADPLWLLGRQWQLGEFEGNDAGTAIRSDIHYISTHITNYQPVSGSPTIPYKGNGPLNLLIEPEAIRPFDDPSNYPEIVQGDLRTAVSLGQDFIRFLTNNGVAGNNLSIAKKYYFSTYSPDPSSTNDDAATTRFRNIVVGRSIDGLNLCKDLSSSLTSSSSLPASQIVGLQSAGLSATLIPNITQAAKDYVNFYQKIFSEPDPSMQSTWTDEQLEYQFKVSAPKDSTSSIALEADQYFGDDLDWYSFSVNPASDLASTPGDTGTITKGTHTVVPSHMEFKGMPNRRWWDLEDAQLDIGSIDVDQVGLPKLLLINFVANQSNNWFVNPFPVGINSLTQITSLTVTDTFGQQTIVEPANLNPIDPNKPWQMFMVSNSSGTPDPIWSTPLFLPPVADHVIESDKLESVSFVKDQGADMVWGVEDKIQNPAGDPVPGFRGSIPTFSYNYPENPDLPKYILATNVPPNWIPFLAQNVQDPSTGVNVIKLQEANMQVPTGSGSQSISPKGIILQPKPNSGSNYYVREEEVPATGTLVTRRFRRSRWTDGTTYLWIGRKRGTGNGESMSGLRFDAIYHTDTKTFE